MARISHYVINVNFIPGKNVSAESNSTSVIFEDLEEMTNATDLMITIVVFNIKGMSSQPTSRNFGMKIHTYIRR